MVSFEEVFRTAAVGVTELWKVVEASKRPLREIENEPREMRRARSVLSMYAATKMAGRPEADRAGFVDLTASLHMAVSLLTLPASEWPSFYREETSDFAYYPLINADLLVPERIAYDQAAVAGSMSDIEENAHYSRLMSAIEGLPDNVASKLYTKARSFIVQGPIRRNAELRSFVLGEGDVGSMVEQAYEPVPHEFVARDGLVRKCGYCGSVVIPVFQRDVERFACPYRECQCHSRGIRLEVVGEPGSFKTVRKPLLTFWVHPGIDEIELFKSLSARDGKRWHLYPQKDEVDIGDHNRDVGIDVKSYVKPRQLGEALSRVTESEGLLRYKRQIVAFPDRHLKGQRDYAHRARQEMLARQTRSIPAWNPEFLPFSQIKKEFGV